MIFKSFFSGRHINAQTEGIVLKWWKIFKIYQQFTYFPDFLPISSTAVKQKHFFHLTTKLILSDISVHSLRPPPPQYLYPVTDFKMNAIIKCKPPSPWPNLQTGAGWRNFVDHHPSLPFSPIACADLRPPPFLPTANVTWGWGANAPGNGCCNLGDANLTAQSTPSPGVDGDTGGGVASWITRRYLFILYNIYNIYIYLFIYFYNIIYYSRFTVKLFSFHFCGRWSDYPQQNRVYRWLFCVKKHAVSWLLFSLLRIRGGVVLSTRSASFYCNHPKH